MSLSVESQRQWAERSVRAVNQAFPAAEFAFWERCEHCLPHALLCAQWIEQYGFTFPEAAHLLHVAGVYLRDRAAQGHLSLLQGREEQAAMLLQRALAIQEQTLGNAHPDVAQTLRQLAELYEKQGKVEKLPECGHQEGYESL